MQLIERKLIYPNPLDSVNTLETKKVNSYSPSRPKMFMKWCTEGEGENKHLVAKWVTESINDG